MEEGKNSTLKEFGTTESVSEIKIISIIGTIEGHMIEAPQVKTTKYEHMIPLLTEAEQNDKIKGILILLNTMGGDVEAGLAISELIRGMSKPSVSLVLGGGHSIGIPLAVCADYSMIASTASMTIHPLRTSGLIVNVPETFEYYNRMQERVIRFVCENSRILQEEFVRMMNNKNELVNDVGTILIGAQAVECGLIDAQGTLRDSMEMLRKLIAQKQDNHSPAK